MMFLPLRVNRVRFLGTRLLCLGLALGGMAEVVAQEAAPASNPPTAPSPAVADDTSVRRAEAVPTPAPAPTATPPASASNPTPTAPSSTTPPPQAGATDSAAQTATPPAPEPELPPNVILIVADDLGYGDLGCYGSQTIRTPVLDQMAAAGTRFTSFQVAQAVCSASRAALLTGCYPNRVGMQGALNHTSQEGIHPDEQLMPELFRKHGYRTGIFGKWHLGTAPMFHPLKHGFDEFWGIPYSNDNSKFHPTLAAEMPPLPVYDDEKIEQTDPDQSTLTRRITEKAVSFIRRHEKKPFFLYVPHVMPHVPLFPGERFHGRSPHGLYADAVEELDWSVGLILAALDQAQITNRTLVLFMSDNGPFLSYGNHAGSAAPLREGKLTSFQGGVRVPFIARWPGRIPAGGVNDEPVIEMDLLPTLAKLLPALPPPPPVPATVVTTAATEAPPANPGAAPVQATEATAQSKEAVAVAVTQPQVGQTTTATGTSSSATPATPTEAKVTVPEEAPAKKIDGLDIGPLLFGEAGAKSPHESLVFYAGSELQAIRSGQWILHFAHPYITVAGPAGVDGKPANLEAMKPEGITKSGIDGIASRHGYTVAQQALALYNVKEDPAEAVDVSGVHPEVVQRLQKLAEPWRTALGDSLTQTKGTEVRPIGRVEAPSAPQPAKAETATPAPTPEPNKE